MTPHAFQRTFMRAALRLGLSLLTIHGVLVTLALLGSGGCARVILLLDAPFVLGAAAIITQTPAEHAPSCRGIQPNQWTVLDLNQ